MESELSINDVAFQLAEANVLNQTSEDVRKELKKEFFNLIDEELKDELATKTIEIPHGYSATDFVAEYHGDWEILHEEDDEVVIIEKASVRPYEILVQEFEEDGNPVIVEDRKGKEALGYVVSRGIRTATPLIDYKRLEKEDEELYLRVTTPADPPPYVVEMAGWFWDMDRAERSVEEIIEDWLKDNPQPRIAKEDIKVKDLAKIQKSYLIRPSSTTVLNVRLAKEDEL